MKDHYLILGISRSESPQGIRRAFRDLVREHHPDLAGPAGTPMFREIVEAYRVLSDPAERRQYDASIREGAPIPVRTRRDDPRRRKRPTFEPVDLVDGRNDARPSAEALLDRILRNFSGHPLEKAEHEEPLLCDILLDSNEARRGGILPIRIPILAACATCHGTGRVSAFACRVCDARGAVASDLTVPLRIPPGVRTGTILDVSLAEWNVRNLWLRARLRVRR
jgi:hypothetical protein